MVDEVQPAAGPGWVSVFPTGVEADFSLGNVSTRSSYYVQGPALQSSTGSVSVRTGSRVSVVSDPLAISLGDFTVSTGCTIKTTGMALATGMSGVAATTGSAAWVTGTEIAIATGEVSHKLGYAEVVTGNAMLVSTAGISVFGRVYLPDAAFPSDNPAGYSSGMTLRQWYAGQALSGFIANAIAANLIDHLPTYAFKLADSMIAFEKRHPSTLLVPKSRPPAVAPPPVQAPNVEVLRKRAQGD